jgi:hypothetical protein
LCPPPPLQDAAPALGGTSLASTGTYVGCVWSEYQVLQDSQRLKPSVASLTGSGLNFLVGRVSYTFGFQGEAAAAAAGQGALPWFAASWLPPGSSCTAGLLSKRCTTVCHHPLLDKSVPAALCHLPAPPLRTCRPLHRHGHRLLLLPGSYPSGPPRPAGWREHGLRWAGSVADARLTWVVSTAPCAVHQPPVPSMWCTPPSAAVHMPHFGLQHLMQQMQHCNACCVYDCVQ